MQKQNETRSNKCTQIAPAFPTPSVKHKPTFEVKGYQAANLNLLTEVSEAVVPVSQCLKLGDKAHENAVSKFLRRGTKCGQSVVG